MQILITGCAGFIGFHLALKRLKNGDVIIGIDNLNDYYDVSLKQARLDILKSYKNFVFYKEDICNLDRLSLIFKKHAPQRVVNLAAQAGVRHSIKHPHQYIQANLVGFTHVIDLCRLYGVEHFVYASTSSVYGANTKLPCHESDSTSHPLSIYAASKKANELIAHTYSNLYKLPTTGLRFFTVYGPWGRPDMAFFFFTRDILAGKTIQVFNHGKMLRDFTYIDDIVEGVSLAIDNIAQPDSSWDSKNPDPATSVVPYAVYNIGSGKPIGLMDYIHALEAAIGKKAKMEMLPMQDGDVVATHASTERLKKYLGYEANVSVNEGVRRFVEWYLDYYHEKK